MSVTTGSIFFSLLLAFTIDFLVYFGRRPKRSQEPLRKRTENVKNDCRFMIRTKVSKGTINLATGETIMGEGVETIQPCGNPFPEQCAKGHAERGDTEISPGTKGELGS